MLVRNSPSQKPRFPVDVSAAVRMHLADRKWQLRDLVDSSNTEPQLAMKILRCDLWFEPQLVLPVAELLMPLSTSVAALLAQIDQWELRRSIYDERRHVLWLTWKYILNAEVPVAWHTTLAEHTAKMVRAAKPKLGLSVAARAGAGSIRSVMDVAFEYQSLRFKKGEPL